MTPYEVVEANFTLPAHIKKHPLQVGVVNRTADLNNSGHWLDMGTGKTLVSTACALYHRIAFGNQLTLVIMPPLLIPQWGRWLRSITPAQRVVEYRGTPAKRKGMALDGDFLLVGIQIFKKEYAKFVGAVAGKRFTLIVDEATMLGNIETNNHEKVFEIAVGQQQLLLSGTPLNKPIDTYALMKFTAPGTYRNLKHFESEHVEERDFYGLPTRYRNLDVLKSSLMINSERVLFEDMYSDTEEPLFIPFEYDLCAAHYKLYKRLAEEELLRLPDGGKIDGTTANKLRHALGQIIVNWGHFSGVEGDTSDAVLMLQQTLDELGDGKLVVFAMYRMTVAVLKAKLSKYGAVTVNSEVTPTQKEKNLQRFMSDPKCRVIVIQFVSGGKGLDGLQHVCNDAVFIEPCLQPRDFHQCVGRLKRMGQKKRVRVRMAIANRTTQVRGFKLLLDNDETVNEVIRNATDLRKAIFGE